MKKSTVRQTSLITLAFAMSLPSVAHAAENSVETADAAQSEIADERDDNIIIVTGEKFGRTLLETNTSVEVLTGEELEDRSIDDLYDAVLRTPNVTQSFGDKGFTIRGIDQRLGAGGGLLVNTIVDGASLPNNQSTFFGPYSAWDIGQIEILRGPQGTTQGRNAIGGAIIINSADPVLGEFGAKARGQYGELNSYQLAGAVNIPLGDSFAIRLSADQRESDGWVFNPTRNEDYDARKAFTGRAKLLFQPSDSFSAKYTLSYTDSKGGEDLVDLATFPDQRINNSNLAAEEGSEHLINTLQLDWSPSDAVTITSISTYYDHDYVRIEDLDNSPLDAGNLNRIQNDDSFVQEVRVSYDNGGSFRGLIGGYYGTFDNTSSDSFVVPTSFVSPFLPAGLISQDRVFSTGEENIAVFGEIEFDLSEKLTVIGGARYDDESRDFSALSSTTANIALPPGLLPVDELIESNTNFSAFLPKFGLRYDLSDNVILGATVTRAYRAGGTSVSTVSGQITEFDPEFTWNYALSLRAQTPDRMFSIEANAFYTDWKDQIVTQITAFGRANGISLDTESVNAGQSEVYGAELSIEARPDDRLTAFAALGFVETKFKDFVTATEDLSGNRFNNASPVTASAGFSWKHPTGFSVSGDINLRSEFYSVSTNDPLLSTLEPVLDDMGAVIGQRDVCTADPCNDRATEVKASTVVNMKAGYEAENWSIFAFARNLLNEDYLTQRNAPENSGRRLGRTGEPRVVGVELNLKFGGI
ncbi:MAG: TonB-dependent receptor [Parasphingorhabdus sp.]